MLGYGSNQYGLTNKELYHMQETGPHLRGHAVGQTGFSDETILQLYDINFLCPTYEDRIAFWRGVEAGRAYLARLQACAYKV